MKNIYRLLLIFLCWMTIIPSTFSRETQKQGGNKNSDEIKSTAAGCEPGSNYKYLDINNVRTLIYSYGNGWFLENAEYEIPKGSKKTSMFSMSLWIGGIDVNNNLKLAAYQYGQGPTTVAAHTKNDFWPGPLSVDGTAAIDEVTCAKYDRLFPITRAEVQEFIAWWDNKADFPNYVIPKSITDWPWKGDRSKGQAYYLAPYTSPGGEGTTYDPKANGSYPYYDFANALCPKYLKKGEKQKRSHLRNGEPDDTLGILVDQVLKGDQTLWSVFNDKGNFHSESNGDPIGLEIRAQAFAFATNDEINNMTFYSYEIINRSTYTLTGTYFSQWVDPDLGFAEDDFVGCDVTRGLGYCFNGKPIDGTGQVQAYGNNPPAIGVDFFQGPYMDPDGRDNPKFTGDCSIINSAFEQDQMAINGVNFGDTIVDNERYGMRRFVYHNNSLSGVPAYMQDPKYAPEYYNFLRGIWKDGVKMRYGGNAHPSSGGNGPECDFMFPELSDICNWGTKGEVPSPKLWTEATAPNNPSDRRFMQSAGPFTLQPGACNYITVGIPWARSVSGTPWESVQQLKIVDDKCQKLFDNCFAVLNGPNAPDLTIQELNKELIIYISNRKTNDKGNNYQERYTEFDPNIPNPDNLPHDQRNDSLYHFEGYQVYQLKDASVSAADIQDPSKARVIFQSDVENNISKLVNWTFDQDLGGNVGTVMVQGENKGVRHSFVVTEDLFSSGDSRLVNHKQYYYLAVSYAYNLFKPYQPDSVQKGQKTPYLRGRNNIKTYTAIPHLPLGDVTNSGYGDGPVITRIEGQGNGGMVLELSDATIAEIMGKPIADSNNTYGSANYPISYNPVYKAGAGPLKVKVIDPLNVVPGEYIVRFDSMKPGPTDFISTYRNPKRLFGRWSLYNQTTQTTLYSDTTSIFPYEQLFLDLGLAITINQIPFPGDKNDTSKLIVYTDNGLLAAPAAIYQDSTKRWATGVIDDDVPASAQNWIRAGSYKGSDSKTYDFDMGNDNPWDPNKSYAKIQGGTFAPYGLTATEGQIPGVGPAYGTSNLFSKTYSYMMNLASIDLVLTPDKSKWTRCPVVEMCNNVTLAEGGAKKFDFRVHASVNIDGDTGVISTDPQKNSDYLGSNGMGWFPGYAINLETGERLNIMFGENSWMAANNGRDMLWNPTSVVYDNLGTPIFGGQHYVYIMGTANYQVQTIHLNFPAYDGGAYIRANYDKQPPQVYRPIIWGSALYVWMPLAIEGRESLWLNNDLKIKVRVGKPYQRYFAADLPIGYYKPLQNNNWPMYSFNTETISTIKENADTYVSELNLINVVPNPYYAYDDYERSQLDNRIKIVNLPPRCTVTIFNVSGTLIRQFNVDKTGVPNPRTSTQGNNTEAKTSIDWDLKNFAGIPISGGAYLIHVKADGLGERTIKWFGILRPTDLNSF